MTFDTQIARDYIASPGYPYCETCLRGVPTAGRIESVHRKSFRICADCALLIFAGDWPGIEQMVLDYQADDDAHTADEHAERASTIATICRDLFTYLQEDHHA